MKHLLVLLLLAFNSIAQSPSTWYYNGNVSLNASDISVNGQEQFLLNASFLHNIKKAVKTSTFEITSTANYTNMNKNGVTYSDDLILKVNPRLVHKNWSVFNYEQVSSIYSRKINLRIETAFGGGTYWVNHPHFQGTIAYSVMGSETSYVNGFIVDALRHSPRFQIMGQYKVFTYSFEAFYQPLMNDWSNYNYNHTTKVSWPIWGKLAMNLAHVKTYESFTITGSSNVNSNLSVGMTFHY